MAGVLVKNAPAPNQALPPFTPGNTITGQKISRAILTTSWLISDGRVKVEFKGSQAYTDGKTVRLPELRSYWTYSEIQAASLHGYANHESAHNRYTDFQMRIDRIKASRALAQKAQFSNKVEKLYATIHNIFEDHRIERMLADEFPGTRDNLRILRKFLIERHGESIKNNDVFAKMPIAMLAQNAFLACGELANHYEPEELLREIISFYKELAPALEPLIDEAYQRLPTLMTDVEVHDLSETMVKRLLDLITDEPQSQAPTKANGGAKGEGEGEGEGEEETESGDGSSSQDPSSGSSSTDSTKPNTADQRNETSEQDNQNLSSKNKDPGPTTSEDTDDQDQADGAPADDEGGDNAKHPADDGKNASGKGQSDQNAPSCSSQTSDQDGTSDASDTDPAADTGQPNDSPTKPTDEDINHNLGVDDRDPVNIGDIVQDILKENKKASQVRKSLGGLPQRHQYNGENIERPKPSGSADQLKISPELPAAIRSLVLSRRRTRIDTRREDGIFDSNAIIPLSIGEPDYFKRRTRRVSVAAAMEILVDSSGSMQPIMRTAIETAQITTEATAAFSHLKTSVVTYTGVQAMEYVIVKEFHENIQQARQRFTAYKNGELNLGGTPTGEALIFSIDRISARREEKKLLVLVTDGMPDDHADTLLAQSLARKRGITTVLIEIGNHPKPRMAFDYGCVIKNVMDLAPALKAIAIELMAQSKIVRD